MNYDELLEKYPMPLSIKEEIKKELEKIKADKKLAEKIIKRCYETYLSNLIEPGEAAGIVAAQSIGEPGTQMSLPPWEKIIIKESEAGGIKIVEIGKLVDKFIDKFGCKREGPHEICEVEESGVYVLSLDENEKIKWKKVVNFIRHEFKGKLISIETELGRRITATPNHSFVTKINGRIVPIEGRKLKIGDKIPILTKMPSNERVKISNSLKESEHFEAGYSYAKELIKTFEESSVVCQENQKLKALAYDGASFDLICRINQVLNSSDEFALGFIKGILDENGKNLENDRLRIVFKSNDLANLVSLLFSRFGIPVMKIRESCENTIVLETLNIFNMELRNKLKSSNKKDIYWDRIKSISEIYYEGKVYDISVEGLETFVTFDGVVTHNTMRTFHYAGVAEIDVTLGLPRLIEILDVRKNPSTPMMTIRLTEEYAKDKEKAKEVANRIEATTVFDVADVITDIKDMTIVINLKKELLDKKQLSVEEVKKKLEKNLKMEIGEGKNEYQLIIRIPEPSYKLLMDTFGKLRKIIIAGIKEIRRVIIRKEGDEYVLYTEGSNLKKVMKVKGVDFTRTLTNNIYEIYEVLGIEAARNAVIREAMSTLQEQGLEVDIRHIMLVADAMTADGELKQIGRHGVAGEKQSTLARAAFEMTVNNLLEAAVRGDVDDLNGITENIIVGQPIKLGTGDVKLVAKYWARK